MGNGFVSCCFLLLILVMHAAAETKDASGETVLPLPTAENDAHPSPPSHSHMNMKAHMDPQATIFFVLNDLKVGKKIPVSFPLVQPLNFLPREEADSIPFSPDALPYLLQYFSISQDSPQAKAMEEALSLCDPSKPAEGETKFCATSFESLIDFGRTFFVSDSVEILKTSQSEYHNSKTTSAPVLQNYTVIQQPKEIKAQKKIGCHRMSYPYEVYYCHSQRETKVFEVSLRGDDGHRVDAVSVCHMDTSDWSPHHISFTVLQVKPGKSEVCHFFPADHLVMVPIPSP